MCQLCALLMPRLELPLIILMTWICLHFRKVIRYTCRNLPKTSQNNQNVFYSKFLNFHLSKVPILKECHFGKMKLWHVEHFWTYLSSHLGVIAEYNSNHAQKWRQICPKVFNPSEFHFSEVTFFQNWYFKRLSHKLMSKISKLIRKIKVVLP